MLFMLSAWLTDSHVLQSNTSNNHSLLIVGEELTSTHRHLHSTPVVQGEGAWGCLPPTPPPPAQHLKHETKWMCCVSSDAKSIVKLDSYLCPISLISNKSEIHKFCAMVETRVTPLAREISVLDAPREAKLLHRYPLLHFNDPEFLVAIVQQVLQPDRVLFLPCPEDSPGSGSDEGTGCWVAHDRNSLWRAENVSKHVSTGHL